MSINYIPHPTNDALFNKAPLSNIKENLNPTIDQYRVLSESTLNDAARSWERLYHTDNMGVFESGRLADVTEKRKLIVNIENMAEAMLSNGIHPASGECVDMESWFRDLEELKASVVKDYGMGAGNIVVRQVVTRTIEKLDVEGTIYQLFTKKLAVRTNEQIILPVINAVADASLDLGPSTEPHILSVSNDAEMIATCGRSGIAVELQHEAIRLSKYNLMGLYLTEAKNALVRWKDVKAIRLAFNEGRVVFDNLDPDNSILGRTTGLSFKTGKSNGSFTLRDFWSMYLYGINKGITCDTVLISTIGWLIFLSDPIMQRFVEHNGGVIFRGPHGQIGQELDPWRAMNSNTRGEKNRITPEIPSALMNVAFRFIITPFVPFYSEGQVIYRNAPIQGQNTPYTDDQGQPVKCGKEPMTNLVMLDSNKAMLYLEEEGVRSAEEKDLLREKTRIHLIERYNFSSMYKGAGILVAKNISVTEDTLDVRSFYTVSLTEARNAVNGTLAGAGA